MYRIFLLNVMLIFSTTALASERFDEQCIVSESQLPIAFWDFNQDRKFPLKNGLVKFKERKEGIAKVPETELYGVRFHYEKKWPDGDAMSELRYDILEPQNHVFEYIKIYQPKNFYHRLVVEIVPTNTIDLTQWKEGDLVVSSAGESAKIAKTFPNKLFVEAPTSIYKKAWGDGSEIKNTVSNAIFISKQSKFYASNNKLSVMWQGKYSNASMVVGTTAIAGNSGGEPGNGYCEALGGKSKDHGTFGTQSNFLSKVKTRHPLCFDVTDNGSIVEFVIERKRSTTLEEPNGIYAIWRRNSTSSWEEIYFNNKIRAYQTENNFFDSGYIFGWSNSGYKEDTDFYLLSWGLWNKRPHFL